MPGKKPDFKVLVSRENGDKNFYTEIGSGWSVANDGISLEFNALPVSDKNGKTKCVLFPRKENE